MNSQKIQDYVNLEKILLHIDDAGISVNSNRVICDLISKGLVGGVSVCVNTNGFFDFSKGIHDLLEADFEIPEVWLHSNLIEGAFINDPKRSIGFTKRFFPTSFLKLFLQDVFYPKSMKKKITELIYGEISEQLRILRSNFISIHVTGLDSHQHVHVIPMVHAAINRLAEEENLKLRIPTEPLYLSGISDLLAPKVYLGVLKNMTLKVLLRKSGASAPKENFIGVIYSGEMTAKRALAGCRAIRLSERDLITRILFHPGAGVPTMDTSNTTKYLNKWHESSNRRYEEQELKKLFQMMLDRNN
jgi:hypothetical protein